MVAIAAASRFCEMKMNSTTIVTSKQPQTDAQTADKVSEVKKGNNKINSETCLSSLSNLKDLCAKHGRWDWKQVHMYLKVHTHVYYTTMLVYAHSFVREPSSRLRT